MLKDKEYVNLVKDQLELYEQKIEMVLKEKTELKSLMETEVPELEAEIKEDNVTLETLKTDRTKDQTSIFELERKLGFLQVHYTYDRAKLLTNSEVNFILS